VAAKFYEAVLQAALLYGSKTWNLTNAVLAWLEGFHVWAAYRMAQVHQSKWVARNWWVYPKMPDVLEECGMDMIQQYIQKRRSTIEPFSFQIDQFFKLADRGNISMVHNWGSGGGSRLGHWRCNWIR
jgi:hypothetical protein